MLNLDTHIVLRAVTDRLSADETALLQGERWGISSIVLWEIAKLSQTGRVQMTLDSAALRELLDNMQIWPITLNVCRATYSLDFASDPADELIAATSLVHGAPLVTRDARLLASKVVPLATIK
jgi:PIN domain nuclease of toxin-antitoxin system